jgi:SAM-dependent methyltransferase
VTGLHADRTRAESFGAVAEQYDRSRPPYPAQLIDDLTGGGAPDVLDVGCGTGIASRAFLARGCQVLGVEPDGRMAAVARQRGVTTTAAWLEQLPTHSDHQLLPPERLADLLEAVGAAVDDFGGGFDMTFTTTLACAVRRG